MVTEAFFVARKKLVAKKCQKNFFSSQQNTKKTRAFQKVSSHELLLYDHNNQILCVKALKLSCSVQFSWHGVFIKSIALLVWRLNITSFSSIHAKSSRATDESRGHVA